VSISAIVSADKEWRAAVGGFELVCGAIDLTMERVICSTCAEHFQCTLRQTH
jgi:hypothetical protein